MTGWCSKEFQSVLPRHFVPIQHGTSKRHDYVGFVELLNDRRVTTCIRQNYNVQTNLSQFKMVATRVIQFQIPVSIKRAEIDEFFLLIKQFTLSVFR